MYQRIAYFGRETLISLRRNLGMTIAGIITVSVSLAVLGAALIVWKMVDHGTEQVKGGVKLEVYLNVDATEQQRAAVQAELDKLQKPPNPQVKSYRYLNKDDALKEFKRIFKDEPDLVNSVDASALPPSFRVAPTKAEFTEPIAQRFKTIPGVSDVKFPAKALKGLLAVSRYVRAFFIGTASALAAAALFLIVNTVRLATYARRREIEVMKLVGASNWFVRIPFLSEGVVQGIIGAGVATATVLALQTVLEDKVRNTPPKSVIHQFTISTGDAQLIGMYLFVLGAVVGIVASVIGLRRFLDV